MWRISAYDTLGYAPSGVKNKKCASCLCIHTNFFLCVPCAWQWLMSRHFSPLKHRHTHIMTQRQCSHFCACVLLLNDGKQKRVDWPINASTSRSQEFDQMKMSPKLLLPRTKTPINTGSNFSGNCSTAMASIISDSTVCIYIQTGFVYCKRTAPSKLTFCSFALVLFWSLFICIFFVWLSLINTTLYAVCNCIFQP